MPPRLFVAVAALRLAVSVYPAGAVSVARPAASRDFSMLARTIIT